MKVTLAKLNESISQYVRGHIVPNAKKKSTLFKIGVAYGLNAVGVSSKRLSDMKELGIADAEDNIDVDKLKAAVNGGLEMAGELPIDELGITLYKSDLDKFFHLVETGAL